MDCQDLQRFIHAYVDDEFDAEDRAAFDAHLVQCDACRRVARFEGRFRERLREAVAPVSAPAALRARIGQSLDGVDRARGRRWPWAAPRGGWLSGWRLVPAGAALAAMVVGVVLWQRSSSEAQVLTDFTEATVRSHRQQLPLDVRDGKTASIRRYFADKVPFAVRPPRLRRDARLVGARLSNLRQHQAAYLRYKVDGEPVSVFVVDSRAMPAGTGRVQRVGHRTVTWRDVRGYRVALFRDGGTGYAVAGDMDPKRLVKLINY